MIATHSCDVRTFKSVQVIDRLFNACTILGRRLDVWAHEAIVWILVASLEDAVDSPELQLELDAVFSSQEVDDPPLTVLLLEKNTGEVMEVFSPSDAIAFCGDEEDA